MKHEALSPLGLIPVFSWVRVFQSLVFYAVFCVPLFLRFKYYVTNIYFYFCNPSVLIQLSHYHVGNIHTYVCFIIYYYNLLYIGEDLMNLLKIPKE